MGTYSKCYIRYFSSGTSVLKNLPAMQVWSLCQEDPLEEGMATHSSILAWRIPWTEEPVGLQSMGSQRVGHDWETVHPVWIGKSLIRTWYFCIYLRCSFIMLIKACSLKQMLLIKCSSYIFLFRKLLQESLQLLDIHHRWNCLFINRLSWLQ